MLLSAAAINVFAQEQELPIVAVLDLAGEGLSESETNAITNLLISSIFETDLVAVIDRNQREQILSEIAFSLSGCTDESCAIEVGKLLAADIMVLGSIDRLGDRLSIDLKAMDVATSKIKGTYNRLFEDVNELVNLMDGVGGQFVQNFTGQLATKKAVLKYEELVPLFISCNIDGADVYIDGDAVGKIDEGALTKTVNRNAEIRLEVKEDGYYTYSEMIAMDGEKTLEVELVPEVDRFLAFRTAFGNGMMGSVSFSIFPDPNWWFVDVGAGFTITSMDPLLVNLPVFVKSGTYIGFDDRSWFRPYAGGVVLYDIATLYETSLFMKEFNMFTYSLNIGAYGGVEFKITDNIRVSAEASFLINELVVGLQNLFQFGFGLTVM